MTVDVTKAQYATVFDTFKNYSTGIGSISVPTQSYISAQTREFTASIALERDDISYQVLQNYSFASTRYYVGTWLVLFGAESVDTNFQIVSQATITGSTMTFKTYVTNTDVASHNVPAFTIDLQVKRFVTPFR
jgi:hypothetical protein